MTKRGEMAENGAINNEHSTRNMQDHQKETKREHKEIQPRRDHTRNDHDNKEPDESQKNAEAEARQRQTYHTPNQAG